MIFIALLFIINQSVFSQNNDTMKVQPQQNNDTMKMQMQQNNDTMKMQPQQPNNEMNMEMQPQQPDKEMNMDKNMKMGNDMEMMVHPFFSHEGVPDDVGGYSLRLSGLLTNNDGKNDGDFAFHFETGLTDLIGLHIRNDGFLDRDHTELMFQFAALRSMDKMSGISPLIEFEFPTKSGGDRHTNVLIGFTTALASSSMAFDQALHYNSRTEEYEYNLAYAIKVGSMFFPVVEILGEAIPRELPMVNIVGGLKARINKTLVFGVALQAPVTERKDYKWQLVFQSEIKFGK